MADPAFTVASFPPKMLSSFDSKFVTKDKSISKMRSPAVQFKVQLTGDRSNSWLGSLELKIQQMNWLASVCFRYFREQMLYIWDSVWVLLTEQSDKP